MKDGFSATRSTLVWSLSSRLTVHAKSEVDDVIDHNLILLWFDEKRVMTGADILGQLLRGIALRDAR